MIRSWRFAMSLAAILLAQHLFASAANAASSINCGAVIRSVTKVEDVTVLSASTVYVPVGGARTVITVPAGAQRCIKVLFTGVSTCGLSSSSDFCLIRAVDNGFVMEPQIGASEFNSEDGTGSSHALAWVRRVGPGTHTVVIQKRVISAGTIFNLLGWTMDVVVTK
jgi:hypothetical protein